MLNITVYRLEKYKFYYHYLEDNEDVEERCVLGFFNSQFELKKAMLICENNGLNKTELAVNEFNMNIKKSQKYIYALSYSYSVINKDNNYIDYEYNFEPQKNRERCIALKEELKKNTKFQHNENKIYDVETLDGFWIERFAINKLYAVENLD